MQSTVFVSGLMDAGAKLALQKSFIPLLGKTATALLHHICTSIEQESAVFRGGRFWYAQSIKNTCWQACMSQAGLRRAKETLLLEGLIAVRQEQSGDRTLWWTANAKKLTRFFYFAEALRYAMKPDDSTFPLWEKWARENLDIIEEFKHLWPTVNRYLYFLMERRPVEKKTQEMPVEQSKSKKLNVRMVERVEGAENPFERKIKAKKPEMRISKWVEYWNSLEYTPKCKRGAKTYAQATKFFNAHRHYRAGQCQEFMLDKDVREYIGLDEINKIPRGGDKIRPEWEMKAHIEQAALAYHPEYAPKKKGFLGGLSQFLYRDGRFGKMGTLSLFLEKVAFPPKKFEDEAYEQILENIEEPQADVLENIQRVFFRASGRSSNQDLSLSEMKTALRIAQNILAEYVRIPRDEIGILDYFFPSYKHFAKMWEERVIERVWQGMPLTALDTNKSLWQRFIDDLQSEMGRDIFTGERV